MSRHRSAAPRVLVLSGHGLNCEEETREAFELAGAEAALVHLDDVLQAPARLFAAQILVLPGGFSYGDHGGAGIALARVLELRLGEALRAFLEGDRLVLGICNGFQVLLGLGLLPGGDAPGRAALLPNAGGSFLCRWVELEVPPSASAFTRGLDGPLSLPIAHGEGRFFASEPVLRALSAGGRIALRYRDPGPNGSALEAAGLTDASGRVLGLMPHPERAIRFTQRPDWTAAARRLRREGGPLPSHGPGWPIFSNAVGYFTERCAS